MGKVLKIGIDARLWNETGVGRYIRNLVKELQILDKKNQYVLFILSKDKEEIESQLTNPRFQIVKADIRWHSIREQLKFPEILQKAQLDLVHFPYFSIPITYGGPFVVTIHDLILHHFPTGKASTLPLPLYWVKQLAYRYISRQAAHKAKKILTVSHATEEEIIQDLRVGKDKIVVTYEGVDAQISNLKSHISNDDTKSQIPAYRQAGPNITYFLYVGNAYPHKNLERLLEAFLLLIKSKDSQMHDAQLIFVGKEDFFYRRLKEKVKKRKLEKSVRFEHEVTDEQLGVLYAHAKAVLQPSLMEGFGLTGLEAMSHGCLVLASQIPSLTEVYADAALYFDPKSISDIAKCMENVDNMTQEEKEKFLLEGKQQVKKFSWKHMAAQTLNVYESCIGL